MLRRLLPIPYAQSYTHPQRVLWEQVALPLAAERDRIDVLFSPGYTAPLRSPLMSNPMSVQTSVGLAARNLNRHRFPPASDLIHSLQHA